MARAADAHVYVYDLQVRASEPIAEATGAEAGIVVPGASAARTSSACSSPSRFLDDEVHGATLTPWRARAERIADGFDDSPHPDVRLSPGPTGRAATRRSSRRCARTPRGRPSRSSPFSGGRTHVCGSASGGSTSTRSPSRPGN